MSFVDNLKLFAKLRKLGKLCEKVGPRIARDTEITLRKEQP